MLTVGGMAFALTWAMVAFTRLTEVAVLWPVNGLVLALCLLSTDRVAKQALLAAFLGNLTASALGPTGIALGTALAFANLLETGFAWLALRTIVRQHPNLGHPDVLWRFSVFAVLLAPVLSGAIAALAFSTKSHHPQAYWEFFSVWWASDALGMALFAPLLVTFRPAEWRGYLTRERLAPMLLPLVLLVGVTLAVFMQSSYPMLFFIFPPLMWLVFRWGFPGATVGGLVILVISFTMTYCQSGPMMLLENHTPAQRFFLLQVFMGTALLSALPIGMILDHRNRLLARLRRREQEFQHQALHDALTGVLNRRGLMKLLADELEKSVLYHTPVSVVVLDVDHFKAYNDTYGHPAGDDCLIWLSKEMQAVAGSVAAVCGRQGGEEFAVVLPGLSSSEAEAWAEVLRARIDQQNRIHAGADLGRVTISVGVACVNPHSRIRNTSW